MRFASPEFLWFLFALPLLGILQVLAWKRRQRMAEKFASAALLLRIADSASPWKRAVRLGLLLGGLFFLVLALARPQWGKILELVRREGLDIVLVQDVSLSMLADDIKPNRLIRARHEISDFLSRLQGDRVGLVAFAGEARTLTPLTLDKSATRLFLDYLRPDWYFPGTDIAQAIDRAMRTLEAGGSASQFQIMILLSDGEEHLPEAVAMAQQAAAKGITIYTVGIGSKSGVPIPLASQDGSINYKRDMHGNIVTTRLEERTLREIASVSGGEYYWAGPGEFPLARVLTDIADRERQDMLGRRMERYQERYQIFVLFGLLLLVLEGLVSERTRRRLITPVPEPGGSS